jgi:hypothetical protein
VRASIVDREHLDVLVTAPAVEFFVFDAQIGEMQLAIKLREVVLERPLRDFLRVAIGMAVVVVAIPVPLVAPPLVLALELVIEHNSIDPDVALCQALCLAFVGAIDLRVVFELPFAFEARIERLARLLAAVSMRLEQVAAAVREDDADVPPAVDANGLTSPCSRRCLRSPLRGSAERSLWSRRSRAQTTRNDPTVASVRDSDPRSVYARSRASWTSSRSRP